MITGQPAANAEALSPPATENAKGKLEAPNTGPKGILRNLKSGRGVGRAINKFITEVEDILRDRLKKGRLFGICGAID